MKRLLAAMTSLLLVALMLLSALFSAEVGTAQQNTPASNATFTAVPSAIPTVFGEPAPAVINDALADLSRRTRRTITLASFDNPTSSWEWKDVVWQDTGFECPAAGRTAEKRPVPGYQFLFNLLGVEYDYRVSTDDRTSLILCSSSNASIRPGGVTLQTGGGNGQAGACPQNLPGRLTVGRRGRVTPGLANRLRADGAYTAAIIGRVPGSAEFEVVGGPKCDGGSRFWQVNYAGQVGWTAEGFGATYWLEPIQ